MGARPKRGLPRENYWQPAILKELIRVFQLKDPLDGMYSVVNQNVQSSEGSMLMLE